MKKILSLFAMCAFLVGISLAGPAFAAQEESKNGATGIGQTDPKGTPPGQAQKAEEGTAKENAPGQQEKQTGKPGGGNDEQL